jgi:CDP-glycerol glycerophosphotransferase (TagB/SpsB family)
LQSGRAPTNLLNERRTVHMVIGWIFRAIFFPVRMLGRIFPKQNNLWVCGAWLGQRFADNPKYLYEYIRRNQPGQQVVWLTRNPTVYKKVRDAGGIAHYFYSPKGIWYALRAKYLVYCVAYQDLSYFCYLFSSNARIINLWHGTPLKRLGLRRTPVEVIARSALIGLIGRECDYVCSASEVVTKTLQHYFKIPKSRFLVAGYPRNDALMAANYLPTRLREYIEGKKVILFMPTFREYELAGRRVNLFDDFKFRPHTLEQLLNEHNAVLLVKLHFRDAQLFETLKPRLGSNSIMLVDDSAIDGDIYPLLARADILITDYSSVFFDYLLLDRPVIFSSFDLEMYRKNDRGFYFDYATVTPGPKADNWEQLELQLARILQGKDEHRQDRRRVTTLVNQHTTGLSSERVFNAVS